MSAEDYPRTLMELGRRFSSEEACREYLLGLRCPQEFACSHSQGEVYWAASRGRRVCAGCGYQATVTAGTVFEGTRKPLALWFRAIWWVTSQKNGASALGLQRVLGLATYYSTAVARVLAASCSTDGSSKPSPLNRRPTRT